MSGSWAMSLQAGLRLPTGYDADTDSGPPLGSGELDADLRASLGRGLGVGYLKAELGYRRRGGALNDEWLYRAELGTERPRWFARLSIDGVHNTKTPPDIAGTPVITPLPGGGGVVPALVVGDQHVTSLGLAIARTLRPGRAVQLEARRTVAGTNHLAGTTVQVGFVVRRP